MFRSCALSLAVVLAGCSFATAEGISSFALPESPAGASFDSSFGVPSPFVAPSTQATSVSATPSNPSRAAITPPPASLLAPSSTSGARTSAFGGLSSTPPASLTHPLGQLTATSTTSSILAAPDRYESGAASRITALPSASGNIIKQFTIPTATMGSGQGLPPAAVQPTPFAPTGTMYFGQ